MIILLSPAKSIDTSNVSKYQDVTLPVFEKETTSLVNKLAKMKAKNLMELMGVSRELAELNEHRFKHFEFPKEQTDEIVPAAFAFSGEVYRGLDFYSLSADELIRANASIRILSGLYGILKPLDLMTPYRLEMGTRWAITPKVGSLYQFWGSKPTDFLKKEVAKDESIINLASAEYFKVIDQKRLKNQVITPVFKEFKEGQYKIVMMYAKHARGAMARYIVKQNIQHPEELKLYDVDGYAFDEKLSSDKEWVFVR
ncbi:MAG: peroxide stress protein YaaA [Cryomorphaceae bacterium]|jgi:cytoplasmic iron level regulating protein YaaA (DUF328/UPF0246 family)|nr:peroxide stress protein YaaA [Cryomorphaceae bacterium]